MKRTKLRLISIFLAGVLVSVPACGTDADAEDPPPPTSVATSLSPSDPGSGVDSTDSEMPDDDGPIPIPTPSRVAGGSLPIDMSMIRESQLSARIEQATMNGVGYPYALIMRGYDDLRKLEINAGRTQKRFRGSLGVLDSERSDSAFQVDISLDGANPVYSALVTFGETKEVDLDVTNVLRIRISVTSVANYSGYLGIGTARFN